MNKPTTNFGGTVLGLKLDTYRSNGALAVAALMEYDDGERENVVVSVNLAHGQSTESDQLLGGEFAVKNYSEGTAVYNALLVAGWIIPTGKTIETGHVNVPVCRLSDKAIVLQR